MARRLERVLTEAMKKAKAHAVPREFKRGTLKSGSKALVMRRAQAVAIALRSAGLSRRKR